MLDVVVAEHLALVGRGTDAIDDGCVVQRVADHDAVGDLAQQALQRGVIRAEAGREHQCRFLAMPVGQAVFQPCIQLVGTADVARTAGARAVGIQRQVHRLANGGMLGHAQVVVAAPDDDGTLSIIRQLRHWVLAADPAQGGEGAVLIGGLQ